MLLLTTWASGVPPRVRIYAMAFCPGMIDAPETIAATVSRIWFLAFRVTSAGRSQLCASAIYRPSCPVMLGSSTLAVIPFSDCGPEIGYKPKIRSALP